MWIAQMTTDHFQFTALGATKGGALNALGRGWRSHRSEYGRSDGPPLFTFEEAIEHYSVALIEVPDGGCVRDMDVVISPRAAA